MAQKEAIAFDFRLLASLKCHPIYTVLANVNAIFAKYEYELYFEL